MRANYLAIVVEFIPRTKGARYSVQPIVDYPGNSGFDQIFDAFTSELHIFRKVFKFAFQISREIDIFLIVAPFEQLLSFLNFFFSLFSNFFGLFIRDKQC